VSLALRYSARSDVGLVRDNNEDSAYAGPRLLAVADGMGGHAGGEVASSIALRSIGQVSDVSEDSDLLDALRAAIADAAAQIGSAAEAHPPIADMGTTLTALLTGGNRIALAHLGDSRAYLLRDGELQRLTRDHTYVQSLVDDGQLTEEEAFSHPRRSLILRVLDGHSDAQPDLSVRELKVGDRFLVCSDGLHDYVREPQIQTALQGGSTDDAVDRLVTAALQEGAPDNVTCVVADVIDVPDPPAEDTTVEDQTTSDVQPEIVGAAGERSVEERLAAQEQVGTDVEPAEMRSHWPLRLALVLLLVALVVAAAALGVGWIRNQYFVADSNGYVTIYRGLNGTVFGVSLSAPYQVTNIALADLPSTEQTHVHNGIEASDVAGARDIVNNLSIYLTPTASPSPSPLPHPSASPNISITPSPLVTS
jgi:PPM family protein phosphatase